MKSAGERSKSPPDGMMLVGQKAVRAFLSVYGKPARPFHNHFVRPPKARHFTVEVPMTDDDRTVPYGELARRRAVPGAKKLAAMVPSRGSFVPIELPNGLDCARCMEGDVSIQVVLDWPVMRLGVMVLED